MVKAQHVSKTGWVAVAVTLLVGCPDPAASNGTPSAAVSAKGKPSTSASAATKAATSASAAASTAAAPGEAARPLYYERAITEAELAGRTLRELALMRNTIYARAGNRFRRPWLNDYFSKLDWYAPTEGIDEKKITAVDRENAKLIGAHDSAITKAELEKRRDEVLARKKAGKALPEDAVELSLLSQRLGTWLGDPDDGPRTPLEDQAKLDAVITVADLETLSRRDLRLLRNTIFARKGRTFESKVVRSYFEAAAWYQPKNDYHDGMLSGVDHKNVQIIRSVEDSLGGPEHENPNYGKDGWFIFA